MVAAVCAAAAGLVVVVALPDVGFVARGLVAGVLLLAGAAKLRDRAAFSEVLAGLGIPGPLGPAVARGLPIVELGLAGALLVPQTSTGGAVGALVLLLVLTATVGVALTRGRAADCGCLGTGRSAALGGLTLLRNGVLVGSPAGSRCSAWDTAPRMSTR